MNSSRNNDEAKYIIHYTRDGIIPLNMDLCTSLKWVYKNIINGNIYINGLLIIIPFILMIFYLK